MQSKHQPIDYEDAIVTVVRALPTERAAQLYDFARFLLEETKTIKEALSDEDLEAEDAVWDSTMRRHADRFANLKAQAKADVKSGRTEPMFDENGAFIVE